MRLRKWLLAAAATVAIVLAGCEGGITPLPPPPPPEPGAWDILFDLAYHIRDEALGTIRGDLFAGTPMTPAGLGFETPLTLSIIEHQGANALLVEPQAGWQGLDFVHRSVADAVERTVFDFEMGDRIRIAGVDSYDGGTRAQVHISRGNTGHQLGDWGPLITWDSWDAAPESFDHEFTLSQANVDGIIHTGGTPPNPDADPPVPEQRFYGLRLRGGEIGHAFILTEIVVRRPAEPPEEGALGDFITLGGYFAAPAWADTVILEGPASDVGPLAITAPGEWIRHGEGLALRINAGRTESWHGIELAVAGIGFNPDAQYSIRVYGTLGLPDDTVVAAHQMQLGANPHNAGAAGEGLSGHSGEGGTVPERPFSLPQTAPATFAGSALALDPATTHIRIQTSGPYSEELGFIVTGIVINRTTALDPCPGEDECDCLANCGRPECDCDGPAGPSAMLPGEPGNLNAVRAANADNIAWDMQALDAAALLTHFAGLHNRMVNSTHDANGQTIVISTDAGSGPGGSAGTHDSQGHGWSALTITRPAMNLGMNYVLHITGRIGNNGVAVATGIGNFGLRAGTDWVGALLGTGTPFTVYRVLSTAEAAGTIDIRWNLWGDGFNPLPTTFAVSIDDMVIVSVEAAEYEVARAELQTVINTANLRVLGGYTTATWTPFASALAAANTAMTYTDVDDIDAARTSLSTVMGALAVDANPAWAEVLASPYVTAVGGGGTWNSVTSVANGLLIHGRDGNNRGLGIDIAGLRAAYPDSSPTITVTGRMSTADPMRTQGMGAGDVGTPTTGQWEFTITVPHGNDVGVPGWASDWATMPWITNADGVFGDFLVTGIQVGTMSIQELLE